MSSKSSISGIDVTMETDSLAYRLQMIQPVLLKFLKEVEGKDSLAF